MTTAEQEVQKVAMAHTPYPQHEAALESLYRTRHDWARTSVDERLDILRQIKNALLVVAEDWVLAASSAKGIASNSPLMGEEWLAGPGAMMAGCNGLITTLEQIEGKAFLDGIRRRSMPDGRLALRVMPSTLWDRLLLSGVTADVWMQPGISESNLAEHAALIHDVPVEQREGKVALILGAGNVASIAPLDVLHKLFIENQVCLLKLNPVNEYLLPFLEKALAVLIDRDALHIVKGDGAVGAWLTEHPWVEEMHITGSQATHDAIVWGTGEEAKRNREAGTPRNSKRFTSELGAVCPTIIVPGPWSKADIAFQAEQLATQKLHNSGFNCVACQVLIMPRGWKHGTELIESTSSVMSRSTRPAYYPGVEDRLAAFQAEAGNSTEVSRGNAPPVTIAETADSDYFCKTEVFGPAMSITELDADDAESFLRAAVAYANDELHGTLGANIVIHPATRRVMGNQRFNEIISELRYGTIAINTWSGIGFLLAQCPWGAFPGHTLEDVQSGIGTVHNSHMLEKTERTVVEAPFRPFPRSLVSRRPTLLPKPPWFITNSRQDKVARLLVDFHHSPGWHKVPRIFYHAVFG